MHTLQARGANRTPSPQKKAVRIPPGFASPTRIEYTLKGREETGGVISFQLERVNKYCNA